MHRFVLALAVAVAPCSDALRAQEPQTEAGARAAAHAWLRAHHRLTDTARVVADSAELWRRFVVCNGPAERPCALVDDRPVTMVFLRYVQPDSAFVSVGEYRLLTATCPLGRPLVPAYIGATYWDTLTFVYIGGKWELRQTGGVAC